MSKKMLTEPEAPVKQTASDLSIAPVEQKADRRDILRREIIEGQSELEEAFNDLQNVLEDRMSVLDVRSRIREEPWIWLAGAFTLGLIIGIES